MGLSWALFLISSWLNFPGFGALGGLLVANVYQVVQYEAEVEMVDGSVENFELIGSCNKSLFRSVWFLTSR